MGYIETYIMCISAKKGNLFAFSIILCTKSNSFKYILYSLAFNFLCWKKKQMLISFISYYMQNFKIQENVLWFKNMKMIISLPHEIKKKQIFYNTWKINVFKYMKMTTKKLEFKKLKHQTIFISLKSNKHEIFLLDEEDIWTLEYNFIPGIFNFLIKLVLQFKNCGITEIMLTNSISNNFQ